MRISFRYLPGVFFCSERIEVVISILSTKHQFPSFFDTTLIQTRCLLIFEDMLICMHRKEALDNFVNDYFETLGALDIT